MVDTTGIPKYPTTALEVFAPREREEPFLNKIWGEVFGGFLGFGGACAVNRFSRRPIMSGIQKHIIYTALGVVTCSYLMKQRYLYYADKDAVLRHYIELHPDDFPLPERKKFADVLLPWVPIR